jgi:hypothetical protein
MGQQFVNFKIVKLRLNEIQSLCVNSPQSVIPNASIGNPVEVSQFEQSLAPIVYKLAYYLTALNSLAEVCIS